MIFYLPRKGVAAMCNCSKNKDGSAAQFVVQTAKGETRTVNSEQEARSIVRISGGSYARK